MKYDTLLLQAKSQKDDERRVATESAARAAQAADARVAEELAAAFKATHSPQRLQAFVDNRLDAILSSGLFQESTCDGSCLLLFSAGAYSSAMRERGGYYGEVTTTRTQALDTVVAALSESFSQFGTLDASALLSRQFDVSGFQLTRASVERVLRDYVTSDV